MMLDGIEITFYEYSDENANPFRFCLHFGLASSKFGLLERNQVYVAWIHVKNWIVENNLTEGYDFVLFESVASLSFIFKNKEHAMLLRLAF